MRQERKQESLTVKERTELEEYRRRFGPLKAHPKHITGPEQTKHIIGPERTKQTGG